MGLAGYSQVGMWVRGTNPSILEQETDWRHRVDGDREFFIGNLLVRIHFVIVMIKWTGLAP